MKYEFVGGRNAVLACLRAKRRAVHRLLLLEGGRGLDEILDAARGLAVERLSRNDLDRRAEGMVHQGVLLEADPLPVMTGEAWLASALPEQPLYLLLDGLQDPQNFGAIVRTGVALGVGAFVFPKDRAAPLTPTVVKAAAGAAEYATFVRVTNFARTIDQLKDRGVWSAALDPAGGKAPWDCDLVRPLALVTGGEGKGIRPLVRKQCDFCVTLPMPGPIPSLNASVATAIILGEVTRQRAQ